MSDAEQMLGKHGDFLPYGAVTKPDGETVSVAGYDGTDMPASQDVIDLLNEGFRASAASGEYMGGAMWLAGRTKTTLWVLVLLLKPTSKGAPA